MAGSDDRILTTHAGSLPRPADVADMIWARMEGKEVDPAELDGAYRRGRQGDRRQAA